MPTHMGIWDPVQGQMLLVKQEPMNPKEKNAVSVFFMIVCMLPTTWLHKS